MQVEAGHLVRHAAQRFGSRTALSSPSRSLSFTELNDAANRVGSALIEAGVRRGDRVGVLAFNAPEVVVTWFGCEKHNLVRVVLHSHLPIEAHIWSLNHVEASTLVFDTRFAADVERHRDQIETVRHFVAIGADSPHWATPFPQLEQGGKDDDPYLDVDEDSPCFLQLTSGTTGHPKAWVKTYRSWQAVINHNLIHLDTFGPGVPPIDATDVNLHFHPIQWASGFQTLYPYFVRGARSVLLDDEVFDPAVLLDTISREGVTGLFMPGPLLTPVLDTIESRGRFEHRLRRMVVFFGTPELLQRTTELMGPIWAHGFGATEQGAVTTRLLPVEVDERAERIHSVGRSGSPFLEVAVVDDHGRQLPPNQTGEIVVRSAMSIGEYWAMPAKTAEAFLPGGWFRSMDVGHLDEEGFLYFSDRATEKISIADEVVFPHLVEGAVLRHPAVANCGVVGLGETGAQQVVAAVRLKPEVAPSSGVADEILARTADLPATHRPTRVIFMDDLPTVFGGAKVQRHALREQLASIT